MVGSAKTPRLIAADHRQAVTCSMARARSAASTRVEARQEQLGRVAEDLQRERRVDHVARRHPVVDETRVRPGELLDDLVVEAITSCFTVALDLRDARDVEACACADRLERRSGNHAALAQHLADGELDAQPEAVARVLGCAMQCAFCLTGRMGLVRHLTAGEIAGQVRVLAREFGLLACRFNLVLMGMGVAAQLRPDHEGAAPAGRS